MPEAYIEVKNVVMSHIDGRIVILKKTYTPSYCGIVLFDFSVNRIINMLPDLFRKLIGEESIEILNAPDYSDFPDYSEFHYYVEDPKIYRNIKWTRDKSECSQDKYVEFLAKINYIVNVLNMYVPNWYADEVYETSRVFMEMPNFRIEYIDGRIVIYRPFNNVGIVICGFNFNYIASELKSEFKKLLNRTYDKLPNYSEIDSRIRTITVDIYQNIPWDRVNHDCPKDKRAEAITKINFVANLLNSHFPGDL